MMTIIYNGIVCNDDVGADGDDDFSNRVELLNGFDTNVNEGGVYGDNNNGCGDGDFDDLILSVLIPVNTLKINIHISFS